MPELLKYHRGWWVRSVFFLLVAGAGLVLGIPMIMRRVTPCSGDGCLIIFIPIFGWLLVVIAGIICFYSVRYLCRYYRFKKRVSR